MALIGGGGLGVGQDSPDDYTSHEEHLLVVAFECSMMEDVETSLVFQCKINARECNHHLHYLFTGFTNSIM